MKIPFGIAQIGKAFRNEIVARQFIFRMREFEQMEMQFFVRSGRRAALVRPYGSQTRMKWHQRARIRRRELSLPRPRQAGPLRQCGDRHRIQVPRSASRRWRASIRVRTSIWRNHQKFSGKKMQYFDTETGESYVPYVVETSIGVDRMVLAGTVGARTRSRALEGGDSPRW